ncbi:unnamed protein product [Closterium sp. Naga37s-1]|nr:unnamed protein product [Closterium sp. Naga37s-1]
MARSQRTTHGGEDALGGEMAALEFCSINFVAPTHACRTSPFASFPCWKPAASFASFACCSFWCCSSLVHAACARRVCSFCVHVACARPACESSAVPCSASGGLAIIRLTYQQICFRPPARPTRFNSVVVLLVVMPFESLVLVVSASASIVLNARPSVTRLPMFLAHLSHPIPFRFPPSSLHPLLFALACPSVPRGVFQRAAPMPHACRRRDATGAARGGGGVPVGITLVGYRRSIDMRHFPKDSSFVSDSHTKNFQCPEMVERRPWTIQGQRARSGAGRESGGRPPAEAGGAAPRRAGGRGAGRGGGAAAARPRKPRAAPGRAGGRGAGRGGGAVGGRPGAASERADVLHRCGMCKSLDARRCGGWK